MTEIVIVGGGISGLAAAWEVAQRGATPVVLESSGRTGGVILTEHVDGFVIDAGPDALLIQKPAAITLCQELGLGDRLVPTLTPRTAFIKRGGRLIQVPEASFLGFPTRVGPFLRTELFSWSGKVRMASELFIRARRDGADESIGSFIGRRFGREAVRYLAEPLLAGIHAGDVDRLSIHALFPRLAEAERTHGSVLRALASTPVSASPRGAFLSLPGGVGELATTLTDRLPPATVRYGANVTRIDGTGPFTITINNTETVRARALILAAPAWASATMLQGVDETLSRLCGEINYASTAIAVFGLRKDQVQHPLNGSGYVVPRAERHYLMAGTWVSSKWPQRAPAGHVLLRAFLGGATDPAVVDQSDTALSQMAFEELAQTLRITGQPALTRIYRWRRASAQHEVGHLARVAAIEARLATLPGLHITGSGFRGTGIPDCVADARATAAKAITVLQ